MVGCFCWNAQSLGSERCHKIIPCALHHFGRNQPAFLHLFIQCGNVGLMVSQPCPLHFVVIELCLTAAMIGDSPFDLPLDHPLDNLGGVIKVGGSIGTIGRDWHPVFLPGGEGLLALADDFSELSFINDHSI